MENWLLIATLIIFSISVIVGYVRGFIKIVVSLVATIATIILVIFLTPYTSKAIYALTPIDEMVHEKCVELIIPKVDDFEVSGIIIDKLEELTGANLSGVDLGSIDLGAFGITQEQVNEMIGSMEIPRDMQIKALENADVPEIFREALLTNNNSEVYGTLGVDNFLDYVGAYVTRTVINIIAFLATFILVSIVVRSVIYATGIISDLPVLRGVNRFAGALLGLGTGLIIIWIVFLVMTLLYDMEIGKSCFEMINSNDLLKFLYEHNYILKLVVSFR